MRSSCVYPACRVVHGKRFALAPPIVSYLSIELQFILFFVRFWVHVSRKFSEHILYVWFVYHCLGLHELADLKVDTPFYACVSNGVSQPFDLLRARRHFWNFRSFTICVNPPINDLDQVPKMGEVAGEPNVNFIIEECAYRDEQRVRMIPLTPLE